MPTVMLTDEQRDAVAGFIPAANALAAKMYAASRKWGRYSVGKAELQSRAHLALCRTVAAYKPDRGASLRTWVFAQMPRQFVDVCRIEDGRTVSGLTPRRDFYGRMEQFGELPNGDAAELSVPAREERGPSALSVWCETSRARRGLNPQARVCLYLRLVEGWSQSEIAAALGLSAARMSHIIPAALRELGYEGPRMVAQKA